MDSNTEPRPDSIPETALSMTDGQTESTASAAGNSSVTSDGPDEPASAGAGDNPDAGSDPAEANRSDSQLPDASSLLAMAAMHMETNALIDVLISVFHAHAWRSMGLVTDQSGEVRKDMASAQTAIDCLAFLLSKIESTLEDTEKRDVQRRLMDLRMNYVAKMREG